MSVKEDKPIESENEDSIDESDSDSSVSDNDSSEYDSENFPTVQANLNDEIISSSSQYNLMSNTVKHLKKNLINIKFKEILDEVAPEYLQPLEELEHNKEVRLQIAENVRKYRMDNLKSQIDAEYTAAEQNYKNEINLMRDLISKDIKTRIIKLDEDRYKADELYYDNCSSLKRTSSGYEDDFSVKRRKPITVTGPVVIYMLNEEQIAEDVNYIKDCVRSSKRNFMIL